MLENPIQKLKLIGGGRSHKYKEHLGPVVNRHGIIFQQEMVLTRKQ